MLNQKTSNNIRTMLLSVIISLAVAEIVVRLFVTVRDVGPSYTVYDPVFGKRLKASFTVERIAPEFKTLLSTNSLGFRGPEPDSAMHRTILFLGDSFTLGYGVSDGQEYPALIGSELRRRYGSAAQPVVNAGIGDSGNGIWLKFLHSEAINKIQPSVVVMQFSGNDFDDNINEKLFALGPDGSLQELPVAPPGAGRKLQTIIESIPGLPYSYLVGLMRQVSAASFASSQPLMKALPQPAGIDPHDKLTLRIAENAISICEARGLKILALSVGLTANRESALKDIFSKHGAPFIVIPAKTERPDLYYKIDGHWTPAGHAFAAARVAKLMEALDNNLSKQTIPNMTRKTSVAVHDS